jgi:hypothetical protein
VNPLLLFGALGLGAYVLFSSSTASAAAPQASSAPPGLIPRAIPAPIPNSAQAVYNPATDPGPAMPSGGVVLDPNLGGVPDMSSQLPSVQPWQSVVTPTVDDAPPTASGTVGWNPFTKQWY